MKIPKPDGSFEEVPDSEGPTIARLGDMLSGRRLDKKRLAIIAFVLIALITTVVSVTKFNVTSFIVKEGQEEIPSCTDECTFENKICENGKIFECVIGQDGCEHKNLLESCPEGSICSTLKEGTCYTPKACDYTFHTCITTTAYQLCKDGKTVEGAETTKCPENLVCNKGSKNFALCVEK